MPITGSYVTSAVVKQLREAYPNIPVYKESQNKNQVRPCFYVYQLLVAQEKKMNNKYHRVYRIKVHYLPEIGNPKLRETLDSMGAELFGVFRLLNLPDGSKVWGREQEYEIVDGVLHFTQEFTIFAEWSEDPGPTMETLSPSVTTKE